MLVTFCENITENKQTTVPHQSIRLHILASIHSYFPGGFTMTTKVTRVQLFPLISSLNKHAQGLRFFYF